MGADILYTAPGLPQAVVAGTDVIAALQAAGILAAGANWPMNLGTGALLTTGAITGGAITGTSLALGAGAITTTGAIGGGAITGTSLSAGAGAITGGAISGTSLASTSGTISAGTSLANQSVHYGSASAPLSRTEGSSTNINYSISAKGIGSVNLNVTSGASGGFTSGDGAGNTKFVVSGTGNVTLLDGATVALGTGTGTILGTTTGQKLGFWAATPRVQPAAPTLPAATAATNITPYGYSQAQADALITCVRAIGTALSASLGGSGMMA